MEKYRGEGYQPKKSAQTSEPPHRGSNVEPRGIKQVRTVVKVMESHRDAEHFDDEVNEAIRDGWKLSRRYNICMGDKPVLVGELARYV